MKYSICTFLILISTHAFAESATKGAKAAAAPLSVNTGATSTANFSSVVLSGQATRGGDGKVTFVVKNSCFGTNLRHVENPLSPIATIRMNVGIRGTDGAVRYYDVQYPAATVTALGMGQVLRLDEMILGDGSSTNIKGTAIGNLVRFKTPLDTTMTVDSNGNLSFSRNGALVALNFDQDFVEVQAVSQPNFPIYSPVSTKLCMNCTTTSGAQNYLKRALPFRSISEGTDFFAKYPLVTANVTSDREYNLAYQKWYNWFQEAVQVWRAKGGGYPGPYMGLPGMLSSHIVLNESRDGKTVEVNAAFPGQEGYCGGYHSPLMVFFDDKRPKFTGESFFPLHPGKTTWPEKGAPGYFIALDKLGDGVITKKEELFGNSEEFKNGFEAFRVMDTNKDGVVDAKDKDFDKLLLWQDKNGDGFSTQDELSPLKDRIKSISLNYDDKTVVSFSNRAEMKGKSTFVFLEKGKEKKGEVLDIWFTPVNGK
jgi:hypothetical protein